MRNIINISLPEAMAKAVEREVKKGKFSTVSEYFRHVLREYKEAELYKDLLGAKNDWDNGKKGWKQLRSLKDLR